MATIEIPDYSSMSRDVLIERLLQLEATNGLQFRTHPRYGLTQAEDMVLGLLASRTDVVSKETAYTFLYGMKDDPPDAKILDVWIHKLRRKLRPRNIEIVTVWGRGWYVDDASRARIRAMAACTREAA